MSEDDLDRRRFLAAGLAGAVLAAAGAREAAGQAADLPTTVRAAVLAFEARFNAGDVDGLMALYDERSLLPAGRFEAIAGLGPIRATLEANVALGVPIRIEIRKLWDNGEVGLAILDWAMEGTSRDGRPVRFSGTATDVFIRRPGGNWVYAIDNAAGVA